MSHASERTLTVNSDSPLILWQTHEKQKGVNSWNRIWLSIHRCILSLFTFSQFTSCQIIWKPVSYQALTPCENQTIKQRNGWADVFGKSNGVCEANRDESWCVDVIVKPEYQPLCGVNTPREKNLFPLFISDWRQNLFHSRVCDLVCFSTVAYKKQSTNLHRSWTEVYYFTCQVKAPASQPVRGAAAGVFKERGAAAGQAAVSVPQLVPGLLVRSELTADQPAQRHLGGAEEDCLGGAWSVVKQQTPSWTVNGGKNIYIYVYMSENLSSFFLKSGSWEAFVCIYDTLLENRVVMSWF